MTAVVRSVAQLAHLPVVPDASTFKMRVASTVARLPSPLSRLCSGGSNSSQGSTQLQAQRALALMLEFTKTSQMVAALPHLM